MQFNLFLKKKIKLFIIKLFNIFKKFKLIYILGDVIPSKSNYMILVGLMLLIGLSLVSTVLTIIQKQIHALADVNNFY